MPSRLNGAYISQVLHTDPESAGSVLDAVYRGLEPVGVGARFVRLGDGLWVSADGLQAEPDSQVVRAVRGVLWFGWWPVRVLVELVEWSPVACEVAIRPLTYRWPVWSDRYARCAAGHLGRLVSSLDSLGGSGISRVHLGSGEPFSLINGRSGAGSFGRTTRRPLRQWNDAATAAARPLA